MERLEQVARRPKSAASDVINLFLSGTCWKNVLQAERLRKMVETLRLREFSELDSRRQGKLLVLEVSARITSANQMCHEIPAMSTKVSIWLLNSRMTKAAEPANTCICN